MVRFHLFTGLSVPGLHAWRASASENHLKLYLHPAGASVNGWTTFNAELDPTNTSDIYFTLFEWVDGGGARANWENSAFVRKLERTANGGFPTDVWLFQDSKQTCLSDPRAQALANVRIHLVTAQKYRNGFLYLWQKRGAGQTFAPAGVDASGPFWNLALTGEQQRYFNFKFRNQAGDVWEGEAANRTWTSLAGAEVWVKSEAPEIVDAEPQKKTLRIHFWQGAELGTPAMRLWQESSDYSESLNGLADPTAPGRFVFEKPIYTGMLYGARFFTPEPDGRETWEHADIRREIYIDDATDLWALEGSSAVLTSAPKKDREVTIHVPHRTADGRFDGQLFCHVWIDRARSALHTRLPVGANGKVTFKTFQNVNTSIKFHTDANWEALDRHAIYADHSGSKPFYAILDRFELLREAPPANLYTDPPFHIQRPGAWEENGFVNFVLHAPKAARVRLWGEWMGPNAKGVDLQSTRDRTFWWMQIPVSNLGDYHGFQYAYIIDNDRHSQDPAAGWVVHSGFDANSKLVRSHKYTWQSSSWDRPTWDYLIVYQAHPKRFSDRGPAGAAPLRHIAWEIENNAGYFRQLGATALLLMPVHEFAGDSSWGYNPGFYYAVESAYGGPDALKELVDACHRNGIAVILDLVLNHSGNDNPLWELSRETFFDGDTTWGALINFDHPQCKFFFEKCVEYLAREYRLDGIRLDHTRTILHGDWQDGAIVTRAGSGGGWDFLKALHWGARAGGGDRCLVMGEHLPNEWDVSRHGGPLDTQWNDNFHDRMEDVFRPFGDLGKLAEAHKITHDAALEWFASTNYAESHDEVGNEDDRVSKVAGYGRGLRAAKVHAAAVLLSRGIPMWFMGAESAEWRQFIQRADDVLPLGNYLGDDELGRVRLWWKRLCELRRYDSNLRGPAPIDVKFAQDRMLAFTRGMNGDYFVLLNFGTWAGERPLWQLNLPDGEYRELWNSTWDEFRNASENEQLQHNGGRDARLKREYTLNIPDTAAIVLQRV